MIFVDKSHSTEVLLPVLYRCLDPAKIPMVDEAAPRTAVSMATLALKTLPRITLPAGVGSDLWPRIWAWFQFLDMHRANLSAMKVTVLRCAVRFCRGTEWVALNATPGFYITVGRVWVSSLKETDVQLSPLIYVSALLTILNMSNLEELMEGAGGSLDSLAALVTQHMDLSSKQTPITQRHLELLRDIAIFAKNVAGAADDGLGPPNLARSLVECLMKQGVLRLIPIICTLSLITDPDPGATLNHCLSFLRTLFGLRKMHAAVLPAAVMNGSSSVHIDRRSPRRMIT
ncbi:hypothetical protein C8R44DRAFT_396676 [Mycena epipterygia]|nr:hypothetical protein C8R44DRAFT_396676 [Mycena epipterygia]